MDVSLTTDYQSDSGCPEAPLRAIAAAGFTHIHWCHHWLSDFLYGRAEIRQIRHWLRELGLKLLDLHGSGGLEKRWYSHREYERLAGVELVQNRLEMTAELGGRSVVMHVPLLQGDQTNRPECDNLRRSMDALAPVARHCGVRLAFENLPDDNFRFLGQLMSEYPSDVAGLCYDCGHGNMGQGQGLDLLDPMKDRLIAVHIHDNDGVTDLHWVPFTGTVDFARLARMIAQSSYDGCVNLESSERRTPEDARERFLPDAYAAAVRLSKMIDESRQSLTMA